MNPDPLDLESPARDSGDPSATSPPPDAGPTEDIPAPRRITEGPGTRIGPYKLLQQIGEGGMGVVYMAEQEQPDPPQGRAQDHQAGDGHRPGRSPGSRPSARPWP